MGAIGTDDQLMHARRGAMDEMAADLRRLRLEAGNPTLRAMARASGKISHTTLHDAMSGTRLPTWPTVQTFVEVCGGDVETWRQRWLAAARTCETPRARSAVLNHHARPDEPALADLPAPAPIEAPAVGTPTAVVPTAAAPPGGRSTRFRLRHLILALLAGVTLGVAGTFAVAARTAAPTTGVCPVTDADGVNAGVEAGVGTGIEPPAVGGVRMAADTTRTTPTGAPSWVGRPAFDAQILTGSAVSLPLITKATPGDSLIVTLMLTSTCPGPVTVTDTLGDTYTAVADETDSARHRTMIFAAFGIKPLTTADAVHVAYSHASKYHVAVDEFRGISRVVGHGGAHGEAGGVAFSTGSQPLVCTSDELMVTAVGTNTGTAPGLVGGWTTLPVLKLSSYRLTTAYQASPPAGTCSATGTTTAQWGAVLVLFR